MIADEQRQASYRDPHLIPNSSKVKRLNTIAGTFHKDITKTPIALVRRVFDPGKL
jgi:hypothetical protein